MIFLYLASNGVSAGKRDQIEIFFKKKFLSKIDVDLIIWSRTFIISKKNFLSIWSLFPALTPNDFRTYFFNWEDFRIWIYRFALKEGFNYKIRMSETIQSVTQRATYEYMKSGSHISQA